MSKNSLEYLIRLAQRTGGKVFVHDPIAGKNLVVMGVEDYEDLLSAQDEYATEAAIRALTEKVEKEKESRKILTGASLEDQDALASEEIPLPSDDGQLEPEGEVHLGSWNRVSQVLQEKYQSSDDKEEKKQEVVKEDGGPKAIPRAEGVETVWKEEPLDDDPVFYEEPVA